MSSGNILQPSFGNNKPADFQRSTVRKSFKRRLPQNLPVRDTCITSSAPPPAAPPARPNLKNSLGPDPPASVARRNARERNRVKQVNTGFAILRQHIPVLIGSAIVYGGSPHCDSSSSSSPGGSNSKKNKMSKVETLRCAVEYIRNLEKLLATGDGTDLQQVKDEPYDLPISPLPESENISPSTLNDLSAFYDSSSSSESPDRQQHGSFTFNAKESPECAAFKQELLRSLSCFQDSPSSSSSNATTDLILDQPAIHNMSDHSLLESINSWWCPNL